MVKNGYSKNLGVLFLIAVLAAIVCGVYYWQVMQIEPPELVVHHPVPVNDWKTYANAKYGFELKYPKNYDLRTAAGEQNYFANADSVASVSIPKSVHPKTNLASATEVFSVKPDSSPEDCKIYHTGSGTKTMKDTISVNGNVFYTAQVDGAAAGTHYQSIVYRILHDTSCYEANLTIGVSNLGNYPAGTVNAINVYDVWNELSAVLVTFKFTEKDSVFCGGLAGFPCPTTGYICVAEGNYPDAGTTCTRKK